MLVRLSCSTARVVALALSLLASNAHALHAKVVATGLVAPLFVTAPAGDPRVFVVEQPGVIEVAVNGRLSTFLDLTGIVNSEGTRGLLGMAFDPRFATNGRFYVDYVDAVSLNTVVARYTVNPPTANRVDPATRQQILSYAQPVFPSHRAGWVGFRPGDRRDLYISTGDGGNVYDAENNAQNGRLLLGKLLRIDVSGAGAGYAVPPDNPFVGRDDMLPEIWALGLRNPFRPSFDRVNGDFWIADVGQDTREEIDFEPAGDPGGHNYGWRLREGTVRTPTVGGPKKGLTDPVFDYPHLPAPGSLGDAITGGFVYRGPSIPEADGRYFFGDYVANHVYSFRYGADGRPIEGRDETAALIGTTGLARVSSFGEDGQGRLYVIGDGGTIVVMCPGAAPAAARAAPAPESPRDPCE